MTTLQAFTRRGFITGVSALAVLTVTGSQTAAATSDPYARSTWDSLLGEKVRVDGILARVAHVETSRHGGFRVGLDSSGQARLGEGLHAVTHPALGSVDLFMTEHGGKALMIFNTKVESE